MSWVEPSHAEIGPKVAWIDALHGVAGGDDRASAKAAAAPVEITGEWKWNANAVMSDPFATQGKPFEALGRLKVRPPVPAHGSEVLDAACGGKRSFGVDCATAAPSRSS